MIKTAIAVTERRLKDLNELIKEVEIISNLDHPNIIKFFETYHDEFYFHIVMECHYYLIRN